MWGHSPCPGLRSRASSGLVALSGLELALWGLGLTLQSFGPTGQGCSLTLQGFLPELAGSELQPLCGFLFLGGPIFCLLLKTAVNGVHQCDFLNFCGTQVPTVRKTYIGEMAVSR